MCSHSGIWWAWRFLFCITVDTFGLNLYYTSSICMCWTTTMCRHYVSPWEDNGEQKQSPFQPTKMIYIITNMIGTLRSSTGCFTSSPHILCPFWPSLLSISLASQIPSITKLTEPWGNCKFCSFCTKCVLFTYFP